MEACLHARMGYYFLGTSVGPQQANTTARRTFSLSRRINDRSLVTRAEDFHWLVEGPIVITAVVRCFWVVDKDAPVVQMVLDRGIPCARAQYDIGLACHIHTFRFAMHAQR